MPAPEIIHQLVDRFTQNREAYRSGRYNEAQLRLEFLNPFFEALGWDVNNRNGYALDYREVVSEDSIAIEGQAKAPDYAFRIGRERKFFVEAKKPSVDIQFGIHPAYQLRRYAWNVHLPLSILSDFEEFAVYDCRNRPNPADPAATGRTLFYKYTQYVEKWDEIAGIFSREAVLKGSFDKYALENKGKKGTTEVDDAFLDSIEDWRTLLARNIALRNPLVADEQQLNYAVQMTIDRIIFLRICEDRGIEPEDQLRALTKKTGIYASLLDLFHHADTRYNSGLFHFHTEKAQINGADTFTPLLAIDDRVLKEIILSMYYPCPYIFKEIPVEILGQVYEQFLGKVIRLTAGHQAKVEEKPEVRKAGGVYYTPRYIVDYIVQNTVGKLLEGKTPAEAAGLKIVDPACGSGSFLLGAYQYLLNWHEDWYTAHDPEKWTRSKDPALVQVGVGNWKLTTAEKKRILVNNIHGVDIDPQAVEVTKLSLLLKVLEEESGQLSFKFERILPDLGDNIKCGNSLIGPDYFEGQLVVDEAERRRVNAFDWQRAFPRVFAKGGFDAVIGNPPYIFTRNFGIDDAQKAYFYKSYQFQSTQLNTFGIFLEKSYELMRNNAGLGFITPNNWLTIDSFAPLRRFLINESRNLSLVNILDHVFQDANVDTAITLFSKGEPTKICMSEMKDKSILNSILVDPSKIKPPQYIFQINLMKDFESQGLLEKIEMFSQPTSNFSTVSTGLKVYQTGKGKPPQSDFAKKNRVFHARAPLKNTYGPYLNGVDVGRYKLNWSGEFLNYGDWIAEPRRSVPYDGPRILVRQIPSKPPYLINGVFTDGRFYNDINSMVIFSPKTSTSIFYILGLLNSKLVSFWFMKTFDKLQRKIFPQFKVKELALFPIRTIDFSNPTDVARHDQMVALVQRMLYLHKQSPATPFEQERLQRDIQSTDAEIDRLVYDLYSLTPEEIKIVEGG